MARGKRNVYVLETNANVETAVKAVRTLSGDYADIYLPNRHKQTLLAESLAGTKTGLRLLPFETINNAIDDRIYGYAQEISSRFARHLIEPELQWAFYVALQDRLVGRLRPIAQLKHYRETRNLGKILWVPNNPPRHTTLWEMLSAAIPDAQPVPGFTPVKKTIDLAIKFVGVGKRHVLSQAQVESAVRRRGNFVVSAALGDKVYRNTVLPLVGRLLRSRPVVLVPSAALKEGDMAPFFADHGLADAVQSGKLTVLDKTETIPADPLDWDEILRLSGIGKRVSASIPGFEDLEHMHGGVLRDIALQEAPRLAAECRDLWVQAKVLAEASAGVVVCPGRPMRSNLLVAAAKACGRKSFEIQSGTIAKNRRFVCPQADRLLVMDDESKESFAHLGRKRGVDVVGSIRLDYDLAPYRKLSKEQAREQIGFPNGEELWTLATQPVGVDRMEKIAAMVFAAAKKHGATVMVKVHPNETPAYDRMYKAVAAKNRGLKVIIERTVKSVLASAASDIVLTHFSTVGIEAFALGKTTVAVNPFDERPTFDLAKMGIGLEARTVDDLLKIAEGAAENPAPNNYLTDGHVLSRCEGIIKELAVEPPAKQKIALISRPVLVAARKKIKPDLPISVMLHRRMAEMAPWKRSLIKFAAANSRWLPRRVRMAAAKLLVA